MLITWVYVLGDLMLRSSEGFGKLRAPLGRVGKVASAAGKTARSARKPARRKVSGRMFLLMFHKEMAWMISRSYGSFPE